MSKCLFLLTRVVVHLETIRLRQSPSNERCRISTLGKMDKMIEFNHKKGRKTESGREGKKERKTESGSEGKKERKTESGREGKKERKQGIKKQGWKKPRKTTTTTTTTTTTGEQEEQQQQDQPEMLSK